MVSGNKSRWQRANMIGVVLGAVLVAGVWIGVTSSRAHDDDGDDKQRNPFTHILRKLDRVLDKLNNGGVEGNHTLRWDQNLPAAQRFVVLVAFANAAVLDKETGLVWQQAAALGSFTWNSARGYCAASTTGGRKGWRLPSVHELASLVDPSVPAPGPVLPAGHPFTNVQSEAYWSSSTDAEAPTSAWDVFFSDGSMGPNNKANTPRVWCVRGPMQESVY